MGWEAVETLRVGAQSRSPEGGPVPARPATRMWQGESGQLWGGRA